MAWRSAGLAEVAGVPVGFDDPVATTNVLDGLRELRPTADVLELPGVGHYPQVEEPEVFARGALRLLDASR